MLRPDPEHPYPRLQHLVGLCLGLLIGTCLIGLGLRTAPRLPRDPALSTPRSPEPAPFCPSPHINIQA